jgi:hypothetical protein
MVETLLDKKLKKKLPLIQEEEGESVLDELGFGDYG